MFNDCVNLKIGWMVSMYIPMVPLGFDMAYPDELQGLCESAGTRKVPPIFLSIDRSSALSALQSQDRHWNCFFKSQKFGWSYLRGLQNIPWTVYSTAIWERRFWWDGDHTDQWTQRSLKSPTMFLMQWTMEHMTNNKKVKRRLGNPPLAKYARSWLLSSLEWRSGFCRSALALSLSLSLSLPSNPLFFLPAFLRIPRGQHLESELLPNLDHFLVANFRIGQRLKCYYSICSLEDILLKQISFSNSMQFGLRWLASLSHHWALSCGLHSCDSDFIPLSEREGEGGVKDIWH